MGAQKVRSGQRWEDSGDAFAFGAVAGRALDAVEIGPVAPCQAGGEKESEEDG